MDAEDPAGARSRRWAVEAAVAVPALLLLAFAAFAGPAWLQRHFLPEFFHPRSEQLRNLTVVRGVAAALALALLLWIRPALGRLAEAKPLRRLAADIAPTIVALLLAIAASELVLEHTPARARHQPTPDEEPMRRRHDDLGWTNVPNRIGHGMQGGRSVEYVMDAGGHRVRSPAEPVDYRQATIVFAGESIITGHGLAYDETIPAQVGRLTGCAVANLGVGGYATDQTYLRLKSEWSRYRRPAAVVVLFMPALFHRNLAVDRPHLTSGLAWRPARKAPRLVELLWRVVPYRTDRAVAEAVGATQEQLAAIVAMARARGAVPVILVPQLTPETEEERSLRGRILDARGLPYVHVPVDAAWHLQGDRHPDARAAARLAAGVAQYLRANGLPACR